MTYKLYNDPLSGEQKVILQNENLYIPFDPANTDYQQYLEWLAKGNEPLPPDEEPK